MSQIKLECSANKKKLDVSVGQIEDQVQICDSLLTQITLQQDPAKIRNYSIGLLDIRNIKLSKNAYNVLEASGDIRYINNYNMKSKIISLYQGYGEVDAVNTSLLNLYDTHFYPYIKSNFDLVNWDRVDINSKSEEDMYYTKEFANIVSTYRYLLNAKVRIYKDQANVIDKYLDN